MGLPFYQMKCLSNVGSNSYEPFIFQLLPSFLKPPSRCLRKRHCFEPKNVHGAGAAAFDDDISSLFDLLTNNLSNFSLWACFLGLNPGDQKRYKMNGTKWSPWEKWWVDRLLALTKHQGSSLCRPTNSRLPPTKCLLPNCLLISTTRWFSRSLLSTNTYRVSQEGPRPSCNWKPLFGEPKDVLVLSPCCTKHSPEGRLWYEFLAISQEQKTPWYVKV